MRDQQQNRKFIGAAPTTGHSVYSLASHPEPRHWRKGRHKFWNIFIAGPGGRWRNGWQMLEFFFEQTLCTQPDGNRFQMWWYGVSGRIAGYFHLKHCKRCRLGLRGGGRYS